MEYLTLPMTRGLNITDSAEGQGGYMVARLDNFDVLPGGGYQTVDGITRIGTRVPGSGPIRALWETEGDVYCIRDDGADAKVYTLASDWVLNATFTGAANGTWEVAKGNVRGGGQRIYLVNGVTQAIYWTPISFGFIATGMAVDIPEHAVVFKSRLWLSFKKSVQFSAAGDDESWTPQLGAAEILMDDDVTAMRALVGNTIGIWSKKNFSTITGTSTADFVADKLSAYGNEIGASADTVQQLGNRTFFKGARGIVELQTAREFGDFNDATISQPILELIQRAEEDGRPYRFSTISRNKTQYIMLNAAGGGIILTLRGTELVGWSTCQLNIQPSCVFTANADDQTEQIYAGDIFGDVYQIFDKTEKTFDGGPKTCAVEMIVPSFGQGNPRVEIHGITANIRVLPVDFAWSKPTLQGQVVGDDLLPFEWDDNGYEIPIDYQGSLRPRWYYRGYIKTHVVQSMAKIKLVNLISTDQPFIIDSITVAFTVAGEDYQSATGELGGP